MLVNALEGGCAQRSWGSDVACVSCSRVSQRSARCDHSCASTGQGGRPDERSCAAASATGGRTVVDVITSDKETLEKELFISLASGNVCFAPTACAASTGTGCHVFEHAASTEGVKLSTSCDVSIAYKIQDNHSNVTSWINENSTDSTFFPDHTFVK